MMVEPVHTVPSAGPPLEVWGGVECTVNRVGDRYFDQLVRNGHDARLEDLTRWRDLGITTVRYPVLWERAWTGQHGVYDWRWADERLLRLRALGMRPIVGLVHHGSGPPATNLLDPAFAAGLATFARAVAQRYPWVCDYTPVNEPLTTARFSALYGHWYPHHRSTEAFARALVHQCQGVAEAMRAIRSVTPQARLVQTEDCGRIFATPTLAYQARFENERRWLSLDLLCGRVGTLHPLYTFLREAGVQEAEMEAFVAQPSPPSIIGINYYLTSDRVLDERLAQYPTWSHGGNAHHRYADFAAARAWPEDVVGHRQVLAEVWERYGLPMAVTEVQNSGSREDQLRWLHEAWQAAKQARQLGMDVRAVTSWALLGSFSWHALVTVEDDYYEVGAYDVRGPQPRPTAVASMVRALATDGDYTHPVLSAPGWWRTPQRLTAGIAAGTDAAPAISTGAAGPRLLITGAHGTLGQELARTCARRGLAYHLVARDEMDIADPAAVQRTVQRYRPWAVLNAAGYVRVDDAEHDRETCERDNTEGAEVLAMACHAAGAQLLTFSSDLVFDGERSEPYVETDTVAPLGVYGRSKAEAETRVLAVLPSALIVRTSAFFGPRDPHNFVTRALTSVARGDAVLAAHDVTISPTYVPDLAGACLDLLIDGEGGVWHLANVGDLSWDTLARRVVFMAGLDTRLVTSCARHALGWIAPRPLYSVLGSARAALLPPLDDALRRYLRDVIPLRLAS